MAFFGSLGIIVKSYLNRRRDTPENYPINKTLGYLGWTFFYTKSSFSFHFAARIYKFATNQLIFVFLILWREKK